LLTTDDGSRVTRAYSPQRRPDHSAAFRDIPLINQLDRSQFRNIPV